MKFTAIIKTLIIVDAKSGTRFLKTRHLTGLQHSIRRDTAFNDIPAMVRRLCITGNLTALHTVTTIRNTDNFIEITFVDPPAERKFKVKYVNITPEFNQNFQVVDRILVSCLLNASAVEC